MRKKWTVLLVCAFMAFASFGGAAAFSFKQADAEGTDSGPIELVTEPMSSAQIPDKSSINGVVIPMGGRSVDVGDKLTVEYSMASDPGTGKAPALWVGDTELKAGIGMMTEQTGTWTYTFADAYSGDITLGLWGMTFTISSATLTVASEVTPPSTDDGPVELVTEPLNSAQIPDKSYINGIVIDTQGLSVDVGDKLTVEYSMASDPGTGKAPALWVGDTELKAGLGMMTEQTGTWTYTFADAYSGNITLGLWGTTFTISSATLTVAPKTDTYNEAIFAGVTEQPDGTYAMGDVTGEIKTDGTVTYGQFEDSTYYISATNASVTRVDLPTVLNLKQAYLDEAVLKFSAKFDFASEQDRQAELRIMYSYDNGTDRNYTVTRLEGLESFKAGEWVEFSLPLYTLSQEVVGHTWGGDATGWFDWSSFRGVGFSISSAAAEGKSNTVSFGNVRVEGDKKDRAITGITYEGLTKTEYKAGEAFNPAGMKVYVTFDDDNRVQVFDYTVESPAQLVPDSTVKVKWDTYEVNVPIEVTAVYTELKIATAPTKTAYKAGEVFDPAGIVLKAVKTDESEEDVALTSVSYTYQDEMLPEGVTQIVFTYQGMTVSQAITVADYENSVALFGAHSMDADGDPADGWNNSVNGNNVVSQATFDAATQENQAKMRAAKTDDTEGLYVTIEASSWAVSRFFEAEVADYDLTELYNDANNQATIAIRYRAASGEVAGTVQVGLANFFDWNLGFHKVDVTSSVVADGEWHTMYVELELFTDDIDGMLWTDANISGPVDLSKIAGFTIATTNTPIDIAGVDIRWNGAADEVARVDSYAPTVTYNGKMQIALKVGDAAPDFSEATAFDNYDGALEVRVSWPEGAVTDGKVNEGTYTVKLYAVDAAGNESDAYNVTVTVESDEPAPNTDPDPTDEPKENNTTGIIIGVVCAVVVIGAACGVFFYLRSKKKKQ